jgi:hypothetical protein
MAMQLTALVAAAYVLNTDSCAVHNRPSCCSYDGAVKLLGHFEDATTIYLVQEMCAKVSLSPNSGSAVSMLCQHLYLLHQLQVLIDCA